MGGDNPARTVQSQPHTQYSAPWAPEALFPNPKAVPVSLTPSSELGQGMMGQHGLSIWRCGPAMLPMGAYAEMPVLLKLL